MLKDGAESDDIENTAGQLLDRRDAFHVNSTSNKV